MKANVRKKWKKGIVVLVASAMLAGNALTIFADGDQAKIMSVEEPGGGTAEPAVTVAAASEEGNDVLSSGNDEDQSSGNEQEGSTGTEGTNGTEVTTDTGDGEGNTTDTTDSAATDPTEIVSTENGTEPVESDTETGEVGTETTEMTTGDGTENPDGTNFQVTWEINPEEGASIDAESTAAEGESYSFRVNPSEGYRITKVTVNGEEKNLTGVEEPGEYVVEAVSADIHIAVEAEKIVEKENTEWTVKYEVKPSEGAVVEGPEKVKKGEDLSFTVKPVEGRKISSVKVNGEALAPVEADSEEALEEAASEKIASEKVSYCVTEVSEDLTVEIVLEEEKVSVSATADDGTVITVSGTAEAMAEIVGVKAVRMNEIDDLVSKLNEKLEDQGEKIEEIVVYDITVLDAEGNETQPKDNVVVTISAKEFAETENEVGAFHAQEVGDDYELEIKDVSVDAAEGKMEIETDSFSPVGVFLRTPRLVKVREDITDWVSGESKWKVKDWDFSSIKETSPGIDIDINKQDHVITVTIPEGYSGPVYINATDAFQTVWFGEYQPGDTSSNSYSLKIDNKSNYDYRYKDRSLKISTENWNIYNDSKMDSVIGFDGTTPIEIASVWRTANPALASLFGVKQSSLKASMVSDEKIGAKLKELGYSGIEDLDLYYLEYYNDKYDSTNRKLEDFKNLEIADEIFGGNRLKVRETNSQVAELGYNFFYNCLFAIAPDSIAVSTIQVEPNEVEAYSVGAYMREEIVYNGETNYEFFCHRDLSSVPAGGNASLEPFAFYLNGRYMTNAWQSYSFGFWFGLELEQVVPPTPTPTPTPDPDPEPTPDPDPTPTPTVTTTVLGASAAPETAVLGEAAAPEVGVLGDAKGPGTADTTPVNAWMITLVAAAGILGGYGIYNKKKKHQK